jgi:peptidoglycan/xylan/chitin deacetylase (PgdA/CDA1 family)
MSLSPGMVPVETRYVSISVDDGYPEDFRAAELLQKYGLQGTFYIPARNPEHAVIAPSQIRELSQRFEIGAHTYNHVPLKALPDDRAYSEILSGKKWLEDVLGESVVSFCYPKGKFNRHTPGLVKRAGFLGARTCLFNLHTFPRNPFLWGLSTHAGDHSGLIQVRHALLEGNLEGCRNFFTVYKAATDWQTHFVNGLNHVAGHGGIAHLYFHSWEISETQQWSELEFALRMIAQHEFTSVTNGGLFRLWSKIPGAASSPETAEEAMARSR